MEQAIGSLFAIAILMASGYVLSKRGYLSDHAVDGLKRLITELTLPLLLFRAFLQLNPLGRNFILASGIFAACAIMGLLGVLVSKIAQTPAPETRFLFQGFEAGMLGYALFSGYHGNDNLQYFAALDMGQVLYVFTVLMAQMSGSRSGFPWRDIAKSKVLWAIRQVY
jgi:predicted permease